METHRIKRIIIIILALLNTALLLMLANKSLQRQRSEKEALAQLSALYDANGIALRIAEAPDIELPASASVLRNPSEEEAFISALLGEHLKKEENGSATKYTVPDGSSARIRSNGSMELEFLVLRLDAEKVSSLLRDFSYQVFPASGEDGEQYIAIQYADGRPLLGAELTLTFEGGLLSSLSGYYVSSIQEGKSTASVSSIDALTLFLRYTQEQGIVCGGVDAIAPAWFFSSSTLFQSSLVPVLLIRTDTSLYYVNFETNEIGLAAAADIFPSLQG